MIDLKIDTFMAKTHRKGAALAAVAKEIAELPKELQAEAAKAMNSAMSDVKKDLVKGITQEYFIKPAEVRHTLYLKKATADHLECVLVSSGSAIPTIDFDVSPNFPGNVVGFRRGVKGVRVRIKRSSPRDPTGYFVAQMDSGHVGVFERKKPGKRQRADNKAGWTWRPIQQKFGPAVPSMMREVLASPDHGLEDLAAKQFKVYFDQELMRALEKKGWA